jgi:hypothetical protein
VLGGKWGVRGRLGVYSRTRGGGVDADNVGGFLGCAKSARVLGLFLKIVH